ncbi:WD40 repeat-like protein [Polychaeton citri CBS 116435]|uniref:WD40 repeat-like protein n=1 Tax=Polychaeton citri CBS 116435 TaxID=1314669 RepID=A0A9P4Q8V3_9PEZI|nr:WD40 repeat-like protein [Polychaeton citri CBS 116435]
MRSSSSHLDEGYSEDTRSDADASDASMNITEKDSYYDNLLDAALGLPIDQRRDLAYAISKTLPVSHIAFNKTRLDHLLYFDPVAKLPNELFYLVLADLSPHDLLTASVVSRPWRDRTRDERLWRYCFAKQGWMIDSEAKGLMEARAAFKYSQGGAAPELQRRPSRKRGRAEAFAEGEPAAETQPPPGSRPRSRAGSGERMEDVQVSVRRSPGGTVHMQSRSQSSTMSGQQSPEDESMQERRYSTGADSAVEDLNSDDLQLQPTMFQNQGQEPKFSWPWLYKQRRRLEDNWAKGNYQMFSLPHPQHRDEGHEECVYTIQHAGDWLVSGSRDRTIRKWDLETCRLRGKPLKGHSASVLCLQFDPRPEHDLIVSGGSDSWVIIWRFSTGEMLHKMTAAHSESVLNLRFDDRYIVTCSKDKTIKVWNRHAIRNDDPIIPQHTLANFNNPSNPSASTMIEEYTMLCSLTGHHAAVNAVQIQNDIIVSASGDRTIKAWDIHTGHSIKTFLGHTKGIACVQFDGRRVVSGSSDNTVRIFDAEKAVEVACLEGHSNLVRTVQARFGDLDLMTDEELSEEALRADKAVFKHMMQGGKMASMNRPKRRNAGSSRPEDVMSIGAKIPPGGGGSRWARIVSGSYDERVIIWSKDRDGNWRPLHSLSQNHLLQHPTRRALARAQNLPIPANYANLNAQAAAVQPPQAPQLTQQGNLLLAQARQHLNQASNLIASQQAQASGSTAAQTQTSTTTTRHQQPAPTTTAATQNPPAQLQQHNAAAAANQNHGAHHHHHHHHAPAPNRAPNPESSRVFKLQFDARRIICCSQNKVIVGWDFANGDPDLAVVGSLSSETA